MPNPQMPMPTDVTPCELLRDSHLPSCLARCARSAERRELAERVSARGAGILRRSERALNVGAVAGFGGALHFGEAFDDAHWVLAEEAHALLDLLRGPAAVLVHRARLAGLVVDTEPSAGDRVHLTGDVARLIRQQIDDHRRDVFGVADLGE